MLVSDEAVVFAVLIISLVLFIVGKWRYDIVAIGALLALAIAGIVPGGRGLRGLRGIRRWSPWRRCWS